MGVDPPQYPTSPKPEPYPLLDTKKKRPTATVTIFGAAHVPAFHWEALVFGIRCINDTTYTTVRSAKRAAKQWCNRVGLSIILPY